MHTSETNIRKTTTLREKRGSLGPRVVTFAAALIYALLSIAPAHADVLSTQQIDALVQRSLTAFDVPGIAVAVIKDDEVVLSKGYGVRSLKTGLPVDDKTVFPISSNTKAFTTAALAILVDEKKISWSDRVTTYIPEFKLSNPYVTNEFTILDLLTHRSGLGLGAGDLMLWPSGGDFRVADVIRALPILKTTSSFRSQYAYDNILYILAGELVARVSGMSWEDFVEKRILSELSMKDSAAALSRVRNRKNFIDAHVSIDKKLQVVQGDFGDLGNAATGIHSSVSDMSQWVRMQLNGGTFGDARSKRLFSAKAQKVMWSPHTIIEMSATPGPYNSHFLTYGLGWVLTDVSGYMEVRHIGGATGISSLVTLLPELKLGIVALANGESLVALKAITNSIKDGYLGLSAVDRISANQANTLPSSDAETSATDSFWDTLNRQSREVGKTSVDTMLFVGTYRDEWFGDVRVFKKDGKLMFASLRSPKLSGEMFFYKGTTFAIKWYDRSMQADAFATFNLGKEGLPTSMTMEAISDSTDFSYDFRDLNFKVVKGSEEAVTSTR